MHTIFRSAQSSEADTIYALYRAAIGTPFCAWDESYPGLSEIHHDLETDNLFVLEANSRIIGAISIAPENELDWLDCWSSDRNAGEFARVIIHPEFQGQHLAKLLVSNILSIMKKRGYEYVHISVSVENIPAQNAYRHFGFTAAGQQAMWGHMFYLYELSL